MTRHVQQWVASLHPDRITGLQLDPLGELAVIAGQDALAKHQFDMRLATPNLSVSDRAYTLLLAVRTFGTTARNVQRMQTALGYLAQLDALPVSMVTVQFTGHARIAEAYYDVGDARHTAVHLAKAFALIPNIPFASRDWHNVIGPTFVRLADVWSGQPNGRTRIDSLAAWLRPYTQASAAMIASDSNYYSQSRVNADEYEKMLRLTKHLGRPAPMITAQYWLNTSTPTTPSPAGAGATSKALDDGKIRLMELGDYGCPGCLAALPSMEQIRNTAPSNVEVWFVSNEDDVWGATRCTPETKVQYLKQFYIDRHGYGLPIAIWIEPREQDIDGGTKLQESPVMRAYQLFGTPTFVLTDGRGIVRHIGFADSDQVLRRSIQYLIAEDAQRGQPPVASGVSSATH